MSKETPISQQNVDLGGFLAEIRDSIKDMKLWQSRFNNQLQLLLEEIRGETEEDREFEEMNRDDA